MGRPWCVRNSHQTFNDKPIERKLDLGGGYRNMAVSLIFFGSSVVEVFASHMQLVLFLNGTARYQLPMSGNGYCCWYLRMLYF